MNMDDAIPEAKELVESVQHKLKAPPQLIVQNDNDLAIASDQIRWVQTAIKTLTEKRLSITRPLDESKKNVMAMFAMPLANLEGRKSQLNAVITAYEAAVAEQREAEQRAENERAQSQEASERSILVDGAEQALADGNIERAEALLDAADNVHVPAVNVAAAKRPGVSMKSYWSYKVTDESKIPDEFWILDEKRLGALARAEKDKLNIPGIEAVEDKQAVARRF